MAEGKAVAVKDSKETEIRTELRSGGSLKSIIPQDAEQAFRMAQMIVGSGMAPKDMATPQQVVAAIFHGAEIGLQPMQAVQSIAVINGRPTVWGDAALGLVQSSGLLLDFEERIDGEGEGMSAYCRAKRKDNPSPIMREFSVVDAKAAGLWNKTGPWKQYPKRMLQMRARSWVLRDGFADILKGTHIREEVMDYQHPATAVINAETPVADADALRKQAATEDQTAEDSSAETEPETSEHAADTKEGVGPDTGADTSDLLTINRKHGEPAQYESVDAWVKAMCHTMNEIREPENFHEFWANNAANLAEAQKIDAGQVGAVIAAYQTGLERFEAAAN